MDQAQGDHWESLIHCANDVTKAHIQRKKGIKMVALAHCFGATNFVKPTVCSFQDIISFKCIYGFGRLRPRITPFF